jgi:hypothetical protein
LEGGVVRGTPVYNLFLVQKENSFLSTENSQKHKFSMGTHVPGKMIQIGGDLGLKKLSRLRVYPCLRVLIPSSLETGDALRWTEGRYLWGWRLFKEFSYSLRRPKRNRLGA